MKLENFLFIFNNDLDYTIYITIKILKNIFL